MRRPAVIAATLAALLAGCQPVETAPGDPVPEVVERPSWLAVELAYDESHAQETCENLRSRIEATEHETFPVTPYTVHLYPDFQEVDADDTSVTYAVTCDAVAQYQVNAISAFTDRFTVDAGTIVVGRP